MEPTLEQVVINATSNVTTENTETRRGKISKTYTRNEFKTKFTEPLKVIKNPKTGKLFLAAGSKSVAAISHKCDLALELQVIEFDDLTFCVTNVSTSNVVMDF